jgi:hypothetical protein
MSNLRDVTAQHLLETGVLALFRVVETATEPSLNKGDALARAELVFEPEDDSSDPSDVVEWVSFGFLFTLATLSFHDTRPRGLSEREFQPHDAFSVDDFFACLSFGLSGLRLQADYVRGRCMKTDVTVRPDGTVTVTTRGRGESVLRWLDQLQGKQRIAEVPITREEHPE